MSGSPLPGGVWPAAVTPFDDLGRVDEPGVARLMAYFRAAGCDGVVVAGTTGEGPSLTAIEKRDLVRLAVPLAVPMPVVLGIATASLEEAVWLGRQAANAGAAGLLVMPPSFFGEASEAGIAEWYRQLLDRTSLPILAYHFPKRARPLTVGLLSTLANHDRLVGLKDSSGDPENLEAFPGDLRRFVGDERLLLPALRAGWAGTISGSANTEAEMLVAIARDFAAHPE